MEATLFCDELTDAIFHHGYCMDLILNADETYPNYQMFLSNTLAAKADREAPEAEKCEEHVSVLMCTNACGSF